MKTIVRIITLLLMGIVVITIFNFSEQAGSESRALSRKVSRAIIDILPKYKDKNESEKSTLVLKSQAIIRKVAHVTEYTMLGIVATFFLSTFNMSKKVRVLIVLMIGFVYAISDEIHQIFTPNRTPMVTDVFIDTSGVILGIVIASTIIIAIDKLYRWIKKIAIDKKETVKN